mmetsp:Transcript_31367/g.48674  ORF Transcript_31367/g.48674 Transcript_31367/m.48674 type:complete len:87 (+) Transcript_31367:152-412(+)
MLSSLKASLSFRKVLFFSFVCRQRLKLRRQANFFGTTFMRASQTAFRFTVQLKQICFLQTSEQNAIGQTTPLLVKLQILHGIKNMM